MNRFEYYSIQHHQQTHFTKTGRSKRLPSRVSISSSSTDLSSSSFILSMCPLSFQSNNDSPLTRTNSMDDSCENTPGCKICKQTKSTNQFNKCYQCFQTELSVTSDSLQLSPNDLKANKQIIRSQSLNYGKNKDKKKFSYRLFTNFLRLHGHEQPKTESTTSISTHSSLYQIILRPQLSFDTTVKEKVISPPPSRTTSPPSSTSSSRRNSPTSASLSCTPPPLIHLSPERIKHCEQRQMELDRVIQKLVESITRKTNENIAEIPKYWSYLKQSCLDQLQPKKNQSQIFTNLLKSTLSDNQIKIFIEENEQIKARLDILTNILTTDQDKYSIPTIDRLFDFEEQSMTEYLRSQLEFLLASYSDELLFIHERIRFYQSCPHEEKNADWIQIIKMDYPFLIEKMSNDFIMKIPQVEQILIDMLGNMKKYLLVSK